MKRIAFTLGKLEHALALQRWGSFSRAAEELGLTQPTLSRSISALEELWGLRMFERGRTGVTATRVGREMLRQAEQLIGLAHTLDHNMQLRASARAGPVAFGMSGLMSTVFMPEILSFLSRRSPDMQVTTKIEPLSVLLDHLRNDVIEFAIFVEGEAPDDPSFTSEKVGEMPIGLIARADHPLTAKETLEWRDFAAYSIVCSSYLQMGQLDITPTIICDNFGVAREFVLGSDAVWLSSRFVVRDELERGIVRELRPRGFPERSQASIWVTSPVGRMRSPAGRLVLDHLGHTYRAMTQ